MVNQTNYKNLPGNEKKYAYRRGLLMCPVAGLILAFLSTSCNNDAGKKELDDGDSTAIDSTFLIPDSTAVVAPSTELYVWSIDFENRTRKKNPRLKETYYNADTIIKGLNILHPEVLLESQGQHNDTLFTQIKNSSYLTEQMGSSGASDYIANAVINLTSVKGIRYVKIDFEAGSHASPDTWSGEMFSKYKEIP